MVLLIGRTQASNEPSLAYSPFFFRLFPLAPGTGYSSFFFRRRLVTATSPVARKRPP
jgi:hypothetical protein